MKSIAKYLFAAVISALAIASCTALPEYEALNPDGTPVKLTLSGDKAFSGGKASIKVTADVPVPADVTVNLSLDSESTIKTDNITLPALIIKQGETEAAGTMEFDPTGLRPGATFKIVIKGTVAGVDLAQRVSMTYTTEEEPEPPVVVPSAITIDGDMSDWANIKGLVSEDGPYYEFKTTCDSENIYFYAKRNNHPDMWGGGYFYFDIDIDSNPNTGTSKDDIGGLETWMYMYFFLADEAGNPYIASAPSGSLWKGGEAGSQADYTCPENSCKGIIGEDFVEIEVSIPLKDLDLKIGDDVTIYTWGNKSASNFKSEPAYLKIKDNSGEPAATGIAIDGDMSDWANIKGVSSEDGPLYEFKATTDAEYIYFYEKRNNHPDMWGGGYFYFDIDIDSNPNTGTSKDDIGGLETWMYMYFFLADEAGNPYIASAPSGAMWRGGADGSEAEYTCLENSCKGVITEDYVEIEIRIPLKDLDLKVGDDITIYTWGNKSASNLKSEPIYLKVKDNGGAAPAPKGITIDGDMSDWASIKGVASEDGPLYAFKATSDADNVYFYVKRNNHPDMWGGGYFYFDFDLDSNPNTGTEKDSITGLETWMYMYYFLADEAGNPYIASAPKGELWLGGESGSANSYASPADCCKGVFDDDYAEIEIALPRAALGIKAGDDATIYCWGNKSGSNFKSEPVYLKFK